MKRIKNPSPKVILITGASSGIGKALALEYAGKDITLGLIARNLGRLKAVEAECHQKGATVEVLSCDVCETETVTKWIHDFDLRHPVDLIISNAGISSGTGEGRRPENLKNIKKLFETNVFAAIQVGQCLFEKMKERGHGQIAFTGSIAGFQGWAGAPAYTSSKSALHTYAESLRMLAAPYNISVSIIAPGFITSSMTDKNDFPMPFKISAELAAQKIVTGLSKKKKYIIFPRMMFFISTFSKILPESFIFFISKKVRGKTE